jgi:hypothetical protein
MLTSDMSFFAFALYLLPMEELDIKDDVSIFCSHPWQDGTRTGKIFLFRIRLTVFE